MKVNKDQLLELFDKNISIIFFFFIYIELFSKIYTKSIKTYFSR